MSNKQQKWRQLQPLKVHHKNISKTAKKAEKATMRHAHQFVVRRWDNVRNVRHRILAWMLGVVLLIAVVGVQIVWFQQSYLKTASVQGGVYAEAAVGAIDTLNPLYATSEAELATGRLLFSSLYQYDQSGHVRPDTARTMKADDTSKVYTVTMRKDVRWSDGTVLTAKDVIFTVGLMQNPAVRATSTINAGWKDIDVKALNDYTVQFTLPAAYAAFPQALTFSILPEHILKDAEVRSLRQHVFSKAPVGSGPFTFRLMQQVGEGGKHKIVHLAANDLYHAHRPAIDRFQLHAYGTMDDAGRALRTGEVGAAAGVSGDVARNIDKSRYLVMSKPMSSGVYAIINTTQPITKELPVRQALQLAASTAEIRNALYGTPPQLDLPFPSSLLSDVELPSAPKRDIEKAKQLLDDAGWKMTSSGTRAKDGQELKLHVVARKNSDYEKALELLAGQWGEIGVGIDKQVVDPTAADQSFAQTVLRPRSYDVLIDELFIGGDPDVFAYWHSRGLLNFSNYANTVSDDALVSGRSRAEPELRAIKYKVFAQQWLKDVPAIGLYQPTMVYVKNKQYRSLTDDQKIISPAERYVGIQNWTAEQGSVYKTP
ncbi:MAG: peptide ABC transporter substrate-binding protein [Candidatus Saccharimonadales bacterium]